MFLQVARIEPLMLYEFSRGGDRAALASERVCKYQLINEK